MLRFWGEDICDWHCCWGPLPCAKPHTDLCCLQGWREVTRNEWKLLIKYKKYFEVCAPLSKAEQSCTGTKGVQCRSDGRGSEQQVCLQEQVQCSQQRLESKPWAVLQSGWGCVGLDWSKNGITIVKPGISWNCWKNIFCGMGTMSCGQGPRLCRFVSYFPCDFGILGLFICTSVPPILPSFSFILRRLQSIWKHVYFLYGSETLTHYKKHSGQTPEQSCCSQCHLSIVNRVLPWSVFRGDQCVRLFIQHCHSVYTPIPLQISFDHKHWRLMIHSTWKMAVWNFRWDDCWHPWGLVITTLVVLCQAAETCKNLSGIYTDQPKLCLEWCQLFCCFSRVFLCDNLLSYLLLASNNQWGQTDWTKHRGCTFKKTGVYPHPSYVGYSCAHCHP